MPGSSTRGPPLLANADGTSRASGRERDREDARGRTPASPILPETDAAAEIPQAIETQQVKGRVTGEDMCGKKGHKAIGDQALLALRWCLLTVQSEFNLTRTRGRSAPSPGSEFLLKSCSGLSRVNVHVDHESPGDPADVWTDSGTQGGA